MMTQNEECLKLEKEIKEDLNQLIIAIGNATFWLESDTTKAWRKIRKELSILSRSIRGRFEV